MRHYLYPVLFLILATAPAVADATRPKVITPDQAKHFTLDQDVIFQDYVGDKEKPPNFTLSKCIYQLTHSDESGEYYTGEMGCFKLVNWGPSQTTQNGVGGIWIPRNTKKRPRLYMVVGIDEDECIKAGFLICALQKAEIGRFKLMPNKVRDDAIAKIHIVSGS